MIAHPLAVRITHWSNAAAMTLMIGSGWQIYNASPLFPFVFPSWLTLGHWLGGALAWHFAAMWLLAVNFSIYLGYGLLSGHIRRRLFPLRPRAIWRDAMLALRFRLPHDGSQYNAVQRLPCVLAGCGIALAIVSGLAIWKPVQLYPLTFALSGYEFARRVHFLAMAGLVAFVVVHPALFAIVPRTLRPMLTGRVSRTLSTIAAGWSAHRAGCSCAALCRLARCRCSPAAIWKTMRPCGCFVRSDPAIGTLRLKQFASRFSPPSHRAIDAPLAMTLANDHPACAPAARAARSTPTPPRPYRHIRAAPGRPDLSLPPRPARRN